MAPDDDLAKYLPEAPPRPDRREAAIAEAMRRFDGEAPRAGAPTRRPAFAWPRIGRAPVGAFGSLALIAVIGAPVVIKVMQQQSPVVPLQAPPAAMEAAATENGAKAGASTAQAALPEAAKDARPSGPALAVVPAARSASSGTTEMSPAPERGFAQAQPSAAPAPPPPPPPPAAPVVTVDSGPLAGRSTAALEQNLNRLPQFKPAAKSQEQAVVVTGSRISRPDYAANSPIVTVDQKAAADEGDAIVLAGSRRAADAGNWNSCTVLDPVASLAVCKGQVNPAAKGAAGRAAAFSAQGLSRGWQGDMKNAVAAFDAAIAIAPKNAFAHLNRGIALAQLGETTRALASFDQAIRYDRSDPRGYFHRAKVLHMLGQNERAAEDERRVLRLGTLRP